MRIIEYDIDSDGGEPNEIVRKAAVIRGQVRFRITENLLAQTLG